MSGQTILKHVSLSLILMGLFSLPLALAAQPAPKGKPSKSAGKTKSPDKKAFTIQETYREAKPFYVNERGIVGLDMLIQPNHYPVVERIFKGTPAYNQDVRIGDTILAINGVRAIDKSLWQVDQMISDIPGEVVTLTILRDGKLRKIDLTVMPLSEATSAVKSTFKGE